MGNAVSLKYRPDVTPHPEKFSAYDPNFGFPTGRQERGELEIDFHFGFQNFVYLF